jgi:hypothetical protein
MSIDLGDFYEITNPDSRIFIFNHLDFNLYFHYEDRLFKNYNTEITYCENVIKYLRSESIYKQPDWIFSLNDEILAYRMFNGLIIRKEGNHIKFGITGKFSHNGCYIKFPIGDFDIKTKVIIFYKNILEYLKSINNKTILTTLQRILE